MRGAFLTGLVLVVSAWVVAGQAAELRTDGEIVSGEMSLQKIVLSGQIMAGDLDRLKGLTSGEGDYVVALDSRGGDYREGLKLAGYFQDRDIGTIVEAGSSCLSACALAFLGGTMPGEEGSVTARSISPTAKLGFHAPYIEIGDGAVTRESVERAYDTAVRTITDFMSETGALSITPEVAAEMMTPQRTEMFVVDTVEEAQRVGVEVQNIPPPAAFTLSMAKNLCANGWDWKRGIDPDYGSRIPQMIADLGWKPEKSRLVVKSEFFGDFQEITRLLIPVAEAGEGSGYYWCMIDKASLGDPLELSCRGYIFGENLRGAMAAAQSFDNARKNEYGTPEFVCEIFGGIEPLDRNAQTLEDRWALVPADTQLSKINDLLSDYVGKEPPI